ncbi:hypothetical protein [Legionella drozanskii]|uniref:Uncharacterized protein n=1 Tax=Legionella drozanskii LLAP-1 TaxID=1212489 RepID=A0A0W0SQU8_9GAMM|nr:hypothetical protein [Legionella drozanskii]KTC85778.1 hypothetical protein Ldro_2103 [Legionella drozanskii LLAP-1]
MTNPIDQISSLLFQPSPTIASVIALFFVNFLISVLVSYMLLNVYNLEIVKRRREFTYLLVSIGSFIPLLGNILILVGMYLLKKYGRDFHPVEVNVYPTVEYSRKNPVKIVAYATSWADIRLHSPNYSPDERHKALYSISRGLPRETNLIYSSLVSDDLEELRISAFSMLEVQQDYLQTKISQLLKKYEEAHEPYKAAVIAKQIALLYWELVYRNLSEKEFRSILLERSEFFANVAMEALPEDTALLILLSRINIENGKLKEGLYHLSAAAKLQAPSSKIIPYLAELAYKRREYSEVREYLCTDSSFRYILKINKIVEFWCEK